MMVRTVNNIRRSMEEPEAPAPDAPPPADIVLLTEIRDALVDRKS